MSLFILRRISRILSRINSSFPFAIDAALVCFLTAWSPFMEERKLTIHPNGTRPAHSLAFLLSSSHVTQGSTYSTLFPSYCLRECSKDGHGSESRTNCPCPIEKNSFSHTHHPHACLSQSSFPAAQMTSFSGD